MTRAAPATASWRPASRCCSSSCWPLPRPASPRLAPYPARPCSCSASPAASRPRRTVLKRRRGSRLPLRPCGWWCTTAAPRAGCRTPPSARSRRSHTSRRRRGRSSSVLLCAVCLEDVRAGEVVRQLLACRHLFHGDCVDAWLRAHRTCPLCRCDLSPPNVTSKAVAPAPAAAAAAAVTVGSSPDGLPPV
ncbi:E3 ubiquitin-protein ligase EL5 [Setaria italica]|uniref:E3 ubiquitin-protein ligase EL5 n=1 Tax=Setaria italica TaxID=4555 RepID=UPI000BE5D254|nr:E3 ubiquitin-protein ligase EL5 [Setaria italica]